MKESETVSIESVHKLQQHAATWQNGFCGRPCADSKQKIVCEAKHLLCTSFTGPDFGCKSSAKKLTSNKICA